MDDAVVRDLLEAVALYGRSRELEQFSAADRVAAEDEAIDRAKEALGRLGLT